MSRSCTRNAPTHRATRRSGDCSACRKRRRSRRSASSSSSRSWWTSASFGPIPTARSFPRRLWTRSSSSRGARIRRTRRATTTAIMISTSAGKRSRATRPNWPTISMSSSTAYRIASSIWRSSRGCWSGSRRGSSAARESITASDYTADEMMAAVAARELADGEVVFVGIGLPNLACNLARRTHAPNLVLIYESGAVGATPSRLPVSIGDPALVTGSLMVCGMADVFQLFLQNGRLERRPRARRTVSRRGGDGRTGRGRVEARVPAAAESIGPAHRHGAAVVAGSAGPPTALSQIMILALALVLQTSSDSLATRVRQLADSYLTAYFEQHPDEATLDGVANTRHDKLPDNSAAAQARWQQREDDWLTALRRIDPKRLAGPEWVAYGIMRDAIEGSVGTRVCRFELWSVAHTGGGWLSTITSLATLQGVGTEEARRQTLARWHAVPVYIAMETANHREGLRRGYTAPRHNVEIALSEIDTLLRTPLEQSPLYDPARRDSTPGFGAELAQVIERDIIPAMRGYSEFLAIEYLGRARSEIGVDANPHGSDCYRASIRATTGLALTADSVHRLGVATVEQLENAMRVIAIRSFGTSDVSRLLERLRSDTAYTFHTREEMLERAREALARARDAIPRTFGRLPRAPVIVEPYPAFRERQSVGEWNPPAEDGSRPGIYYLSTYDARHKSRADLEPLSFHETIPGHHLQGTIALERGDTIPAIARYFWSPGMGEGWAEYAEQLADEMELYSSDTTRLGMLADITLSATLLVVDTGIHWFGWTRAQSIDYIREHTRVPLLRAEVGVDRYPVWPAQGLSYGLGRIEIRRLRALAEQTLGAKFDIRAFHDRVLENGAVPLPMLRAAIYRWLDASR